MIQGSGNSGFNQSVLLQGVNDSPKVSKKS